MTRDARDIFAEAVDKTHWDEDAQVDVLISYIDRQPSLPRGDMISQMLRYINENCPNGFADYIQSKLEGA